LGEGRFMVSDADTTMQLKLLQRELNDMFNQAREVGFVEQAGEEIKAGELYLYRDNNLEVFRARVLQIGDSVSCRLIDFGICLAASRENFYVFGESDFCNLVSLPAFITRVNLPTDETLKDLGLPTTSMIKEGDIVDMVVFTTTEPQLAVFSFARSSSQRLSPEKFTDGFDEQALKNWTSLFSYDSGLIGSTIARHGFGQLKKRDYHVNRLALIAYAKALDKVYVHDLASAIRISFLRERLDLIYGNEKIRSKFIISGLSELSVGVGCVAYHKDTGAYVRAEVVAVGPNNLEAAPIDMPNLGLFSVDKESVFKIPESLHFPRQCFAVRMTRHSDGQHRHYFSDLARCVLPDKTPVILNSEPTIGLVQIHCSNAPQGVLAKVGFTALKHDKFQARISSTITEAKFGKPGELVAAEIEDLTRFAQRTVAPKKPEIRKKIDKGSKIWGKQSKVSKDSGV